MSVVDLEGNPVEVGPSRVPNPEAVETIERILEKAKSGEVFEFALVFTDESGEEIGFNYSINQHGLQVIGLLTMAIRRLEDKFVERWGM